MTLDSYHRYAAFFDAARALPALPGTNYQFIRISGDEAGEAFRQWCVANDVEITETENLRVEGDRRIAWTTLESPVVSFGVYLDDRCLDPGPPVEPAPTSPEQPIEPEIAF